MHSRSFSVVTLRRSLIVWLSNVMIQIEKCKTCIYIFAQNTSCETTFAAQTEKKFTQDVNRIWLFSHQSQEILFSDKHRLFALVFIVLQDLKIKALCDADNRQEQIQKIFRQKKLCVATKPQMVATDFHNFRISVYPHESRSNAWSPSSRRVLLENQSIRDQSSSSGPQLPCLRWSGNPATSTEKCVCGVRTNFWPK